MNSSSAMASSTCNNGVRPHNVIVERTALKYYCYLMWRILTFNTMHLGGSAKPTRAVRCEPPRYQRVALQPTPARAAGRQLVHDGPVVDVPDFQAVESRVLAVAEPR